MNFVSYETPSTHNYGALDRAYDFFNAELFAGTLPRCLITMQRHKGAYGYFAPERFGSSAGQIVDEIALNPMYFTGRPARATLSTLAHEMAHLWQQHHGKPSRNGYHNKEWGTKMKAIGLYPSSTAAEGGKETGQKVSHYIIKGGAFEIAFAKLEAQGLTALFGDRWSDDDEKAKAKKKKNASKTPFECGSCGLKAWAKPGASLWCGECQEPMVCTAEDDEGDEQ